MNPRYNNHSVKEPQAIGSLNMAILTSTTLIRSLSLLHLTVAYYLITSPSVLSSQSLVQVLSSSMQLDDASSVFSTPSPTTSLAGVFLAFIALTDLTAASLHEDVYNIYWTTQAPVRLAALFALATWIYVFKPVFGMGASQMLTTKGWGHEAKNGVVFTWAFVETTMMFWVNLFHRKSGKDRLLTVMSDLHYFEGRA